MRELYMTTQMGLGRPGWRGDRNRVHGISRWRSLGIAVPARYAV